MNGLSVIIAVLNEEENIGGVIDDVKNHAPDSEVIIVDNGSKDGTREIAREREVRLVEEENRGKGMAVLTGIEEASSNYIVLMDGDKTYPADSIPELAAKLVRDNFDVVYGSRFSGKPVEMSPIRRLGNRVLSLIASVLYSRTTDLLTGMLAVKRDRIKELDLKSSGFEIETEFFIKANLNNFTSQEIPISYSERQDSKLNPFIDGLKILKTILSYKLWM